ncbi:hypothetical protein PCAR4_290160 [Paraburkholderia caribensis]|nr:hypothetical protein PCAR4_290160 [Paraburkholderia caribensis]
MPCISATYEVVAGLLSVATATKWLGGASAPPFVFGAAAGVDGRSVMATGSSTAVSPHDSRARLLVD